METELKQRWLSCPCFASQEDAERPERHADAERRTIVEIIVPHAPAWECSSRRSASQEDAERPELHADALRRTIVEIIVPHAPAWERSSRRSASQEDAERPERHADAERRTIVEIIVPHAPAWECSSRRSASQVMWPNHAASTSNSRQCGGYCSRIFATVVRMAWSRSAGLPALSLRMRSVLPRQTSLPSLPSNRSICRVLTL